MKAKLIHKLTQFITQLNKYRKSNLNRQIVVKQNKTYERKDIHSKFTERWTCKCPIGILPESFLYVELYHYDDVKIAPIFEKS